MAHIVNLNDISRDQIEALCGHYESLMDLITNINNALLGHLLPLEDLGEEARGKLDEWSTYSNIIHQDSAREIERIVGGASDTPQSPISHNKLN